MVVAAGQTACKARRMPGVMAYGLTRDVGIATVRALGLRVAADCIEQGEEIPLPFTRVFSVS